MITAPPSTTPKVNRSSKMSFDSQAVLGKSSVVNTEAAVADDRRIAQVWWGVKGIGEGQLKSLAKVSKLILATELK